MGETEVVNAMFSAEQITEISTALNTAIGNVMEMFVDLLPVMAVICGVGFGISLIWGLFNRVRHGGQ